VEATANRRDPVDLLVESSQGRMEGDHPLRTHDGNPSLLPRAAAIMAYDLAHTLPLA
jgi:hypothetical protein